MQNCILNSAIKRFILSLLWTSVVVLTVQAQQIRSPFPMEQFIGLNLHKEDPIKYLGCTGFVREYHDWAVDEGNCFASGGLLFDANLNKLPDNKYQWNLQAGTPIQFDPFYTSVVNQLGVSSTLPRPICVTMKQCLPYLAGGDGYGSFSEMKPVHYWLANGSYSGTRHTENPAAGQDLTYNSFQSTTAPASYEWISDWLFHFTKRYGSNSTNPVGFKLHTYNGQMETPDVGLNTVGYIELWNEANKYWIESSKRRDDKWKKATQFTGQEYAAMASAAYDAHQNSFTVKTTTNGSPYTPGIIAADPNMKFVMGGTAGIREYDLQYITDMRNWWATNRTGIRKYPIDVINFHHYNSGFWFGVNSQEAIRPEADSWNLGNVSNLDYFDARSTDEGVAVTPTNGVWNPADPTERRRTFKQRLVELKNKVNTLFADSDHQMELWMSEFGFDTNEKSNYKVPNLYQNGVLVADKQEVQARFLTRAYLEIAAAGWNRAMVFDYRDEKTDDGGLFQASGLLQDQSHNYMPKKSYYAVHTMKEALKGKKFSEEIKIGTDPTFTTDPVFGGHSYWFKDDSYYRMLKFVDVANPTDPNKVVYAVWLPTQSNLNKRVNINLGTGVNLATLITNQIGDIDGGHTILSVSNGSVDIDLTETPVFIQAGTSISDGTVQPPTFTATGISCDAIKVNMNGSLPANAFYRVYYYEQPKSEATAAPSVLNIANPFTRLYSDEVKCNEVIITGLKYPHNEYKIYVEIVVPTNTGQVVSLPATTIASTTSCFNNYIPKTAIIGATNNTTKEQLFDYGNVDFCYPLHKKGGSYDYLGSWESSDLVSELELGQPYTLNAISLLESTGTGTITIDGYNSAGISVLTLSLPKGKYDEWTTLPICNQTVQRLKITRTREARIRKIILKGKLASNPNYATTCCGDNEGQPITQVDVNSTTTGLFANTNEFTGVMRVNNCALIVDKTITFRAGSKIYMSGPNATIIVTDSKLLKTQFTNIRGCEDLWQGIQVEPGGKVELQSSQLRDALIGIKLHRRIGDPPFATSSNFYLQNSVLEDNFIGLSTMGDNAQQAKAKDIESTSLVENCLFSGNFRDLKGATLNRDHKRALIGLDLYRFSGTVGGTNAALVNVLNDLAEGIKMRESILTVKNTHFKSIYAKPMPNLTASGGMMMHGGNAISGVGGTLGFYGQGPDKPVFDKVSNGFGLSGTNFGIENGFFITEGDYMLQSFYDGLGSSLLMKNKIVAAGRALSIWKGGGAIAVMENDISCGESRRSVDAVALSSSYHLDHAATNAPIVVQRNKITGVNTNGSAILSLAMVADAELWRNNLVFRSYESDPAKPAIGISLNLAENTAVWRNNITGIAAANFRQSYPQVGILSANSRFGTIYCNTIDGAKIGMQFQYNNASGVLNQKAAMIAGNSFESYDVGLKVDDFGIIGQQPHKRNEWKNNNTALYTWDALLENPTTARIAQNQFKVQRETTILPTQISPNNQWFSIESPTSGVFDCITVPRRDGTGTGEVGIYQSIADNSYQMYTQDPQAYVWMLEKQAFEEFSNLPPTAQTTIMQTFLSSKQGTEIETFYQLKKGFEELFQANPIRAVRLKLLNTFMNLWAEKKYTATTETIPEDLEIAEKSQEYLDLAALEKQSTILKAQALLQLNATLPDEIAGFLSKNTGKFQRPYVFYEKVLNQLYLTKIIEGTIEYTEKEKAIVKKIAMMCPLVAGEAPMKARTLYKHFMDPVALPTANCDEVPKRESSPSTTMPFRVYPNPISNMLVLETTIDKFEWSLYNATGAVLKKGQAKSAIETIDVSDLANGVYLMQVTSQDQKSSVQKVVIVK